MCEEICKKRHFLSIKIASQAQIWHLKQEDSLPAEREKCLLPRDIRLQKSGRLHNSASSGNKMLMWKRAEFLVSSSSDGGDNGKKCFFAIDGCHKSDIPRISSPWPEGRLVESLKSCMSPSFCKIWSSYI